MFISEESFLFFCINTYGSITFEFICNKKTGLYIINPDINTSKRILPEIYLQQSFLLLIFQKSGSGGPVEQQIKLERRNMNDIYFSKT